MHYATSRKDNLAQYGVLISEIIFLLLASPSFPICFHPCLQIHINFLFISLVVLVVSCWPTLYTFLNEHLSQKPTGIINYASLNTAESHRPWVLSFRNMLLLLSNMSIYLSYFRTLASAYQGLEYILPEKSTKKWKM